MLNNAFGTVWILAGLYILLRPTALQNRLRRKGARRLRVVLFAAGLFLSGTLISFGWNYDGRLPKLLLAVGVIGLFKALMLLRGKGMEALLALSMKIPPLLLRVGGACYVAIGCYLIWFKA